MSLCNLCPYHPTNDHNFLFLGKNEVTILEIAIKQAFRVYKQKLHRKMNSIQLPPRYWEISALKVKLPMEHLLDGRNLKPPMLNIINLYKAPPQGASLRWKKP